MKYADFMGKDICINIMNCVADATKNTLDIGDTRRAMDIINKDSGTPYRSTAAMHVYWRKLRTAKEGPSHGPCYGPYHGKRQVD